MAKRILAAEDSPTQAEMLRADLEDAGFDVEVVGTGEEAVARFEERRFDLVVSDVVMPGIDGYETCRRIKARGRDVPVILLTSLRDPIEIVHGLEAGADNFLRKPYDARQLVSRLRTMLLHRELRASGRASVGLEVMLRERRFMITAERQQILDLLMSSFEDLVVSNAQLTDAQTRLERQLEATERERLRVATLLGAAPEPMVIIDDGGRITDASDRFPVLVGRRADEVLGQDAREVLRLVDANGAPVPFDALPVAAALRGDEQPTELGAGFDLFLDDGQGDRFPVVARGAAVRDGAGRVIAAVGSFYDVGALAAHDPVTKLPNQALFAGRVAEVIADLAESNESNESRGSDGSGGSAAVVALVIDRFAFLRESLPILACDQLLAGVGDQLRAFTAEHDDVVARASYLGGDAFAVLLAGLDDDVAAVRLANALFDSVTGATLDAGDVRLSVQASLGVAVAGADGDAVEIIATAAAAARRASTAGGGRVEVADAAVDARAGSRLRQEAELRAAIAGGQLVLHYQPHVDLRSGTPIGVEALVRWQHPERGLLPPADFLPLASQTGLVVPLGWWVLDAACRQATAWQATLDGASQLIVSVNLDAAQLADPELADRVAVALRDSGLAPDSLVLEITESGVTHDADLAARQVRQLKALGVRVAVDDFGTGYSSLAHLRAFPVDFLKIDQSFVDRMVEHAEDGAIVAASVRLARTLGLHTIAEGVETEEQVVQLRMLGCDLAQGYHWSRPLPADELAGWWRTHAREGVPVGAVLPVPLEADAATGIDEQIAYLIHELRTPLTSVIAYADLAAQVDEERRASYLEIIARNARDLDSRITLLAEARAADEGRIRLEPTDVDAPAVVRDLVADLAPQLADRKVLVNAPVEAPVRVDLLRFRQALTNLLTNAVKFSPPGEPVEVQVLRTGDVVEVAVRDHGPGVPEERRQELFRRYARLGSRAKGMGVGLYLVRAIARAHGGDARYEPAPGGGARFVLAVPATPLLAGQLVTRRDGGG